MASDPLTALDLASNLLQFIDFTTKVVSGTSAIYKSSTGTTINSAVIESIAKDAQRLNNLIQGIEVCPSELKDLVTDCSKFAGDLLNALARLRVQGRKTRWKCFVAALKSIWDHGKVDSFLWKISKLQEQIGYHLQALLLDRQSDACQAICKLEEENRRLGSMRCGELKSLERTILEKIQELNISKATPTQKDVAGLHENSEDIDPADSALLSQQMGAIVAELHKLHETGRNVALHQSVLKSLFFKGMHGRYDTIIRAHHETFKWVFNNQHPETPTLVPILSWLRSQNDTFWIQGKAGSGKSTFMKFLCDSPETYENLRAWSGDRALVTAHFFFWQSGEYIQKSLEGLLRSLIFEILRQCPDAVNEISYTDHGMHLTESSWTWNRLLDTIEILTDLDISTSFCFFIDGLDECEGCASQLIQTLELIRKSPHIKICVSSRPFTEFIDEYGNYPNRFVKLEDLTKVDIRCYVLDTLANNSRFRFLRKNDPTYSSLVEEVVAKAQGVFLWVYLAVRSLLEGLKYADRISDMRRRLAKFPKDLEAFFYKMFLAVPPFYRCHTARAFKLALSSAGTLPLMLYSFLDDVDENPGFAFELETCDMTARQITSRTEQMRKQLDARTKGLLEVFDKPNDLDGEPIPSFDLQVGFLHRTVKDYLETSRDVRDLFHKHLEPTFDIGLCCCMAYLALFKCRPYVQASVARDTDTYIHEIVCRAKEMQSNSDRRREADKILKEAEHSMGIICHTWSSESLVPHAVLACSVQEGLHGYVDKAIQANQSLVKLTNPCLLDLALRPTSTKFDKTWASPAMVQTLLNHGALPNQLFKGSTVWELFLQRLARRDYSGRYEGTGSPQSLPRETEISTPVNIMNSSGAVIADSGSQPLRETSMKFQSTENGIYSLPSNSRSTVPRVLRSTAETISEDLRLNRARYDLDILDDGPTEPETDETYLDSIPPQSWRVCFGPNGESTIPGPPQHCAEVIRMLISKEANMGIEIRLFIEENPNPSDSSDIWHTPLVYELKVKARSFLCNLSKFGCPELVGILSSERESHTDH